LFCLPLRLCVKFFSCLGEMGTGFTNPHRFGTPKKVFLEILPLSVSEPRAFHLRQSAFISPRRISGLRLAFLFASIRGWVFVLDRDRS
jgi:hypothetical protein